jgi:large subunit ribosomal protein L20
MPRVKRGTLVKKRHKKLLKETRGYKHGRKKLFRVAKQAYLKAGQHAFRDRRRKKREFRALWIVQLNAAARNYDLKYSEFVNGLKKANITLNRKVLAQLAQEAPEEFEKITAKVKAALKK